MLAGECVSGRETGLFRPNTGKILLFLSTNAVFSGVQNADTQTEKLNADPCGQTSTRK
jgi:hypothetical protein